MKILTAMLVAALSWIPTSAHAIPSNCTHTIVQSELPYTISAAGLYCLGSSMTYTPTAGGTTAITINSTGLSPKLDFNGFTLKCGDYNSSTTGVAATGYPIGAMITGGTLDGFNIGVYVDYSIHTKISDMAITGGVSGIYLSSNASWALIEHNYFHGMIDSGIQLWYSNSSIILRNTFSGFIPGATAAILIDGLTGIYAQIIENQMLSTGSYGVDCRTFSPAIVARNNTVSGAVGTHYTSNLIMVGTNY